MSLNRDAILSLDDRVIEKVYIPAWKDHVFVRSLTGAERDRFESERMVKDRKSGDYEVNMENLRARLVEMAACDEAGAPLFQAGDAAAIGKKNAAAISAIYDVAARLSGITKEDLEEIVKNSEAGRSDEATSD